jgi:integrase
MTQQQLEIHMVRWERAWTRANRAIETFWQYRKEVYKFDLWAQEQGLQTSSLEAADLYLAHVERSSTRHMARYAGRAIKAYGRYLADEFDEPSPYAKLKLTPEPAPQKAPTATAGDLDKLLEACVPSNAVAARPWEPLRDQAIILTLAGTGMRRGEVANMTLDDLDLVSGSLKIPKTKSGDPRTVHLPEDVVGALLRYLRASEKDRPEGERHVWLGSQNLKPIVSNGIGQMLYRKKVATGVDVSAHSFRRMYAGTWMAKGGSEVGLMTQAGWKSTAMIARYTKDTKQANALTEAERLFG